MILTAEFLDELIGRDRNRAPARSAASHGGATRGLVNITSVVIVLRNCSLKKNQRNRDKLLIRNMTTEREKAVRKRPTA